jgi:hypothetical protein
MAPENAEKPAAAIAASDAYLSVDRATTGPAADVGLLFDMDARVEQVEIIADWREDLTRWAWQAQLRFELIGLDSDEDERLKAEVSDFARCCRALTWRSAA